MYRMINPVKAYAWGDSLFIQALLGLDQKPLAELWLGAHPSDPSCLITPQGTLPLDTFLELSQQPALAYLFKVLAAASPLSIQVHPSKAKAEQGFARENASGIRLDDPKRNYKDANHKPEMLYALTDFEALCGFRSYAEIIELGKIFGLQTGLKSFNDFAQSPSAQALSDLIRELLSQDPDSKAALIHKVLELDIDQAPALELQKLCRYLQSFYPGDAGCLFPLFLNSLRLKPGEAIFISHSVPHAYLKGAGLELMASSDNVLRGALTPKYIDIDELMDVCSFAPQTIPKVTPVIASDGSQLFSPPVDEFELTLISKVDGELKAQAQGRIALCLKGIFDISDTFPQISLQPGESIFITADETITITGEGLLAVVGLPL